MQNLVTKDEAVKELKISHSKFYAMRLCYPDFPRPVDVQNRVFFYDLDALREFMSDCPMNKKRK